MTFTPTDEYRSFWVTVEDEYGMRFHVTIPHALGPRDALNLAREKVWVDTQAEVTPLSASEVHDCGFAFSVHDTRQRDWRGPFGCPPDETAARERWGR